jgi:hypothetical protein
MKIISRGEIPEAIPLRVTCRNCHSEIEFVPSEVKCVFDQRDGDFYQFDCPVCRKSVTRAVSLK